MNTGSDAFAERVMAAIAQERTPSPTRTFLSAVRARSVSDGASSVRVAWHLSTVRNWSIAPAVRVRALALVVAVLLALGVGGTLAAATAIHVVNELGEVENNPSGVDEQGEVENRTPDADDEGGAAPGQENLEAPNGVSEQDQAGDGQTDEAGDGASGLDDASRQEGASGADEPGQANDGQGGQGHIGY